MAAVAAPVAAAMTTKASAATIAAGNGIAGGTVAGGSSFFGGTATGAGAASSAGIGGYYTGLGANAMTSGWTSSMFTGAGANSGATTAGEQGLLSKGGWLRGAETGLTAASSILQGNALANAGKAERRALDMQSQIAGTAATERAAMRFRALGRVMAANTARAISNDIDMGSASVQAVNAQSTGVALRANQADADRVALLKAQIDARRDAIDPSASKLAGYLGAAKVALFGYLGEQM